METIEQIKQIIRSELTEMTDKIIEKHIENQENRRNNPFNCFTDYRMRSYMGLGRSVDSQLGNRLQNIAFSVAKLKYSDQAVPNIIFLKTNLDSVEMYFGNLKNCKKQYIFIDKLNKKYESLHLRNVINISATDEYIDYLHNYKVPKNGLPVDLALWDGETMSLFEIKAGGNLDTKNSDSNANEVLQLNRIFYGFNAKSYFATCYKNTSEGKENLGAIFRKLDTEMILVGKEFWDTVLPSNISYDDFIKAYQNEFWYGVEVESKIQTKVEQER